MDKINFNMDKIYDVFLLCLVVFLLFHTANFYEMKGRIAMCNELNSVYLENNECMDKDEFNLRYNNTFNKNSFEKYNFIGEK